MEVTDVAVRGSDESAECERLRQAIMDAARFLPAQGPITVFVHHNTLHALDEQPFEQAVLAGAHIHGCHPYLTEEQFHEHVRAGRIRGEDLAKELLADLGDSADALVGFWGTRFYLRRAMLLHPLRLAARSDLQWVIEEAEALVSFLPEVPRETREMMIRETRHWAMRALHGGTNGAGDVDLRIPRETLVRLVENGSSRAGIDHWTMAEWESFGLRLLWWACRQGMRQVGSATASPVGRVRRHRDWLLEHTAQDSDDLVHELLIGFVAAFVDQGLAHWALVGREKGFFRCFRALHEVPFGVTRLPFGRLRAELKRIDDLGLSPLESIAESLRLLGVAAEDQADFLRQSLLALRGFAGMLWQLETRGDRAALPVPEGTLIEFLAVRLILDRLSVGFLAKESLGKEVPLEELHGELMRRFPLGPVDELDQRSFIVFQLAQRMGWKPETLLALSAADWRRLWGEIESFSSVERRRIHQRAFERQYRTQVLDALAAHRKRRIAADRAESRSAAFQLVTCIDDREESIRRHVEGTCPEVQTFGAAAFFHVAMYYRGVTEAHFTPLCPVVMRPRHYVREEAVLPFADREKQNRSRRRALGTVTHRVHLGSRTFAGGWLAAVMGSLASIPLVARILFPRLTGILRERFGRFMHPPVLTQLELTRQADPPGPEAAHLGFRHDEMAAIVERQLREIGLTDQFARLVTFMGHGSSGMNNPHYSAYDCGACSGGRSGPNARAFAQMANDPRVREILAGRGLPIPDTTHFLGAYHDTCEDSVSWFDLDRIPSSHRGDFSRFASVMDTARAANAHERCRRFRSASLSLSPSQALRHVEERSDDLSQVRPECGHATNAVCIVGRRSMSRGLFLDRRAFLQAYDPTQDDEHGTILTAILDAILPVCAGISLEYYFSFVDPVGYGCGTKLPHNVTSLLGVMNGATSDLQPGLPWQMIELHEPMRILLVIETSPRVMQHILSARERLARLCHGGWVQLATVDPRTGEMHLLCGTDFQRYEPETADLPTVATSREWYQGWRDCLGPAAIDGLARMTAAEPRSGQPLEDSTC